MKHRNYIYIAFISILLFASSCTHNNGDIGDLFGSWKLNYILVDGNPSENYKGNIFFAFQNDITSMKMVSPNHIRSDQFGTWKRTGDKLILTYDDSAYTPFPETYMKKGANDCTILHLSSSKMTLQMATQEAIYTYSFTKW